MILSFDQFAARGLDAIWESENLPQKGLSRILRRIHLWLHQNHQQVAEDFWSQTGGGSHLS